MPGVIESNELPESGGGGPTFETTTMTTTGPVPPPTADDTEDRADGLRLSGLDEDLVVEFERLAHEDFGAAQVWLQAQLEELPHAPQWACECGEPLVADDWRRRATIRCSRYGRRWGLGAKDGGGGRQWSVSGPSDERAPAAHPQGVDDSYGDLQPETVSRTGCLP